MTIRGFPRPAPRREGCKGFYRVQRTEYRVQRTDGELTTDETGLSLYLTQRAQRTQNYKANYATAEVVAGYARQRAQRQSEDEDDKTLSQKDDKIH